MFYPVLAAAAGLFAKAAASAIDPEHPKTKAEINQDKLKSKCEELREILIAKGVRVDEDAAIVKLGGCPRAFERYLIRHRLDVLAAAAALQETLEFRAAMKIDAGGVPTESIEKVRKHWPGDYCGTTADGSPIVFFAFGNVAPSTFYNACTEEEFVAYYMDFMDRGLELQNASNPLGTTSQDWKGTVEIFDLNGVALTQLHFPFLNMLQRVIAQMEAHHPDNLRRSVFINTPRIFTRLLWPLVRRSLHEDTLEVLEFRDDDGDCEVGAKMTLSQALGGKAEVERMKHLAKEAGIAFDFASARGLPGFRLGSWTRTVSAAGAVDLDALSIEDLANVVAAAIMEAAVAVSADIDKVPTAPPSSSGMGRMMQAEAPLSIAPYTPWHEIRPTRSCANELRQNAGVRKAVPKVERVVTEGLEKLSDLRQFAEADAQAVAAKVDDEELLAIILYTHDLLQPSDQHAGNLFYECNNALRLNDEQGRKAAMDAWAVYVHYTLRGLAKLPSYAGLVLRGVRGRAQIAHEYKEGRTIKWTAFTSSTTDPAAATGFTAADSVIFKIKIKTGKVITKISFFPQEGEVLLWPGQKYIVTKPVYEEGGRHYIDMMEVTDDADMLVF